MKPMTCTEFDKLCDDTFEIMGDHFDSGPARSMLWAIGRQEGRMVYRRQIRGPARGLYQFERGGGGIGVLLHPASKHHAKALCIERGVEVASDAVYGRLEHDDILATGFARLLLWTDPRRLPAPILENEQEAWNYYLRNWRPGKPHRKTWGAFWQEACHGA